MPDPDLSGLDDALADASRMAERFGASLTSALRDVALEGRSLEDALRGVAARMADAALDRALAPLEKGASNLLGQLAQGLVGAVAGGLAGGTARADGFGGAGPGAFPPAPAPAAVTLNVSTPDAASFARSEGQIAAMLARTAARGRRSL